MTAKPRSAGRLYVPSDRQFSDNPTSPVWDFLPPSGVPMPPTVEARNKDLIPPTGYLRQYCEWRHVTTDAPTLYQIGSFLTVLSALIHENFRVPGPGNVELRPAVFTILSGPSGSSRKTSSMVAARDLLMAAAPTRIGDNPGSAQGLITPLCERPIQCIFDEDFGEFLQASVKGPMQQLKLLLLKAYDGGRLSYRLKSETYEVQNYSLSYLTAINWDLLERFAEPSDFTGGLFSRFLVLNTSRLRSIPGMATRIPSELSAKAAEYFIKALGDCGRYCPSHTLLILPDAADLFVQWETGFQDRFIETKSRANIAPSFARMMTLTMKVAALYAFERYISAGGTQTTSVTYNDARYAIGLVEEHMASVNSIFGRIAQTGYLRRRRAVLSAIPEFNLQNLYATQGSICKNTGLELREVKQVIETLMVEETIRAMTTGKQHGGYQINPVNRVEIAPMAPPSYLITPPNPSIVPPAPTPSTPLPTPSATGYVGDEPPCYGDDEDY